MNLLLDRRYALIEVIYVCWVAHLDVLELVLRTFDESVQDVSQIFDVIIVAIDFADF